MKKTEAITALLRQAISAEFSVKTEEIDIQIEGQMADIRIGYTSFSVYLSERKINHIPAVSYTSSAIEIIRATGAKYMLIHSERGKIGYFVEIGRILNVSAQLAITKDECEEEVWSYYFRNPITL